MRPLLGSPAIAGMEPELAGAAPLPSTAGLAIAFTALIAGATGVAVFINRFLGNSSH
jgi:hypothetical protein